MKHLFFLLFSVIFLSGCQKKSPEYYQGQAREVLQALIIDMQKIDDIESLREHLPTLQAHFEALSELMIEARKWQIKTGKCVESAPDTVLNAQLIAEYNRLLRMPLARHFIEKAQERALERLDAFEKKHQRVLETLDCRHSSQ